MAGIDSAVPIARVVGVTLDVNDLALEKNFWQAALGVEVKKQVDGWVVLEPLPDCLTLDLQQVTERKTTKNRFHFDLRISGGDEGVRRLEELGASILEHISKAGNEWYVMADPEGNEFCAVIRHVNLEASDEAGE